ncbi:GNAT family N-acetyltransferase [Aeromonas rivipollensis]|uniref:GNAT family N-acetyltransferase n=1 Tax=Aeromonas rivipollensis TaxID=948519 RepID=UPI000D121488|nr:GNAT family N-acetyltransferase [Aeromonas rivipollensis]AVP94118.1 GNAT family N-acetyltransferase [Aeromonas rivipollensis]
MKFIPLGEVRAEDFLPLVNDETLRKHLIDHPSFELVTVRRWMEEKMAIDALPGCRVRAVLIDGRLAGWCGLQPDEEGVEIAIVIARAGWGRGLAIFSEMMGWARSMGHQEVVFHLLGTRPLYKSLARRATRVTKTTLSGHPFTTYYFSV